MSFDEVNTFVLVVVVDSQAFLLETLDGTAAIFGRVLPIRIVYLQ